MIDTADKYKLYMVSYASDALDGTNSRSVAVAGGHWVEVGTFSKPALDAAIASCETKVIGGYPNRKLGIANTMVRLVWLKVP